MRDAMADQHDAVTGAGGQEADPYEEGTIRIGMPMRDADAGGQQEPAVARPWIDSIEQREGGDAR